MTDSSRPCQNLLVNGPHQSTTAASTPSTTSTVHTSTCLVPGICARRGDQSIWLCVSHQRTGRPMISGVGCARKVAVRYKIFAAWSLSSNSQGGQFTWQHLRPKIGVEKRVEQDNDPVIEVGTIGRVKYPLNGFSRRRLTWQHTIHLLYIHQVEQSVCYGYAILSWLLSLQKEEYVIGVANLM